MRCRRIFFGVMLEFFEQFLPRFETGELDFNIVTHLKTTKLDHLLREIDDFYGLAHIEDEDSPPLAKHEALEHEPDRFWDGHEVASDVRVGDSDRPAVGD